MYFTYTLIYDDFNPRSREGSDIFSGSADSAYIVFQSTLPRRERQQSHKIYHPLSVFQSTLPRRERPAFTIFSQPRKVFQSTLPRRERRQQPGNKDPLHYFNPRSREGSDQIVDLSVPFLRRFQSTLPRRERQAR